MSTKGSSAWVFLALAAVAIVGAWMLALSPGPTPRPKRDRDPDAEAPTKRTPEPVSGWAPRPVPEPVAVAPECEPRATRTCVRGDAWWVDSCGTPHELAEDCTLAVCAGGECAGPDPSCDAATGQPRCDRDVARGCTAGLPFEVDCAADGKACVIAEDGPVCRALSGERCDARSSRPRCELNTLVVCSEQEEKRIDCFSLGARCMPTRGGAEVGCVRAGGLVRTDPKCGPCGCPPDQGAQETCDGRDNDGDDLVDENAVCEVVDMIALVAADGDGETSFTQDDLDAELLRVNEAFARDDDLGLSFRWADVVYLDAPEWLELDEDEVQEILANGRLALDRDAFFVPVLFTQTLLIDGVPRPGLATPPNGTCGGQRRVLGRQPPLGGVIIAKQRWGTTVAHELGHFLGLCHTHADAPEVVTVLAEDERSCELPCALEGDGICDTPVDPGPSECTTDPGCGVYCGDSARPRVDNIMGYYPACRTMFSVEQAQTMRTSISLRRGWHDCIGTDGCRCDPGASTCPEGMSCAAFGDTASLEWKCRLNGPRPPGASCAHATDCADSICLGQDAGDSRCVRLCSPGGLGCDCVDPPGAPAAFCREDLEG